MTTRIRKWKRHVPKPTGPKRHVGALVALAMYDEIEDLCWLERQDMTDFVREALDREIRRRRKLRRRASGLGRVA